MATLIFCSCDAHKSKKSFTPLFTFTETQHKQVIKHIKENISDYFDDEDDSFNYFLSKVEEEGILFALNNTDIYATYIELNSIASTKH
jgi:hypothetical protein